MRTYRVDAARLIPNWHTIRFAGCPVLVTGVEDVGPNHVRVTTETGRVATYVRTHPVATL